MGEAAEMLTREKVASAAGALQQGNAALTKKKRVEYGKVNVDLQTNDQAAPSWPEWLRSQGYALDGKGLVYKAN